MRGLPRALLATVNYKKVLDKLALMVYTVTTTITREEGKEMTKTYNFRLPPETIAQLDELTRAYGTNRTAFIILKIAQEYEALQGNPKTKKMLQAMRDCAQILREATGGATELDDPVQLALDTVGALDESESR